MAHECPECGRGCHCNGDIDDCFFEQSEEALSCHHCPDICGPECECEFKEYNDSDAHELSENDEVSGAKKRKRITKKKPEGCASIGNGGFICRGFPWHSPAAIKREGRDG